MNIPKMVKRGECVMYKIMGVTHKGMRRDRNEDRYGGEMLHEDYGYAFVCDGMGGVNGGSLASTLASEIIRKALIGSYRKNMTERSIYMAMEAAFVNANAAIYQRAGEEIETLRGMGTTVCMAVLYKKRCYIGNAGDSRIYLLRKGTLRQVTVDHTKVQSLVDAGEITPQQAKVHKERNFLTKAVGANFQVAPDYYQMDIEPDDAFLVCSDGLYNMVDDENIVAMMEKIKKGQNCDMFIDAANQNGGVDNITAVMVITQNGGEEIDG